jgi:hypothetical protein
MCDRTFSSKHELLQYLRSKDHKPVKYLRSSGCIMRFKDLPAMLQHLESGPWLSKMDKTTIDALLIKCDTTGVVTIGGVTPPQRGNIINSDTPAPMGPLTSTSSESGSSTGILTPLGSSISELKPSLADPFVCPACLLEFKQPGSLASHLGSPVHAVSIYHCPEEYLAELGMRSDYHGVERKL